MEDIIRPALQRIVGKYEWDDKTRFGALCSRHKTFLWVFLSVWSDSGYKSLENLQILLCEGVGKILFVWQRSVNTMKIRSRCLGVGYLSSILPTTRKREEGPQQKARSTNTFAAAN